MKKTEQGDYTELTPEQWEAGIAFCRERRLPVEYGTHIQNLPNLYIGPRTDEDPSTPEWDADTIAAFEAELAA